MASRYLVTGGAGFIGRYLCELLVSQGHHVRVIDSFVEQVHGHRPDRAALLDEVDYIEADLRDSAAVQRAIRDVDGVFHLAAEVGVGQSMYEIVRYTGANDLGTAVLLEAMASRQVERIVVASSMSVYGEGLYETPEGRCVNHVRRDPSQIRSGHWNPTLQDGTPLTPVATTEDKRADLASIYALTKYVQERSTLIFGNAYGVKAVALRLFNVFGPGQALSNPYTGVLANFASRYINGQPPMIFEDGLQRRDFVHVRDVALAFWLAMTRPVSGGQVFNIGSGRSYTVVEVAEMLGRAMGKEDIKPEIMGKARSGDIRHCFSNISKARAVLGFEPQHRLEDSLEELAAWVRQSNAKDRGADARKELETRGLVA